MTLLFQFNFQVRSEKYRAAPGKNSHLCIRLFFILTTGLLEEPGFQASKRSSVEKYSDPGGQVFS